ARRSRHSERHTSLCGGNIASSDHDSAIDEPDQIGDDDNLLVSEVNLVLVHRPTELRTNDEDSYETPVPKTSKHSCGNRSYLEYCITYNLQRGEIESTIHSISVERHNFSNSKKNLKADLSNHFNFEFLCFRVTALCFECLSIGSLESCIAHFEFSTSIKCNYKRLSTSADSIT
ncbi:hypothetical protein Avbf_17601, partial [Armadillidium vulgare]